MTPIDARPPEADNEVLAWHFSGPKLRDGRALPAIGEWLEHAGPIVWCESGLYASRRVIDALSYASGHFISRVACSNVEREDDGKFVCRRRRVIARLDGEALLRSFARRQALAVAHLWDMPDVVRQYLETGDESLRDAAGDAAGAAAGAAVGAAAWDAAWAAANQMLEEMVMAAMDAQP